MINPFLGCNWDLRFLMRVFGLISTLGFDVTALMSKPNVKSFSTLGTFRDKWWHQYLIEKIIRCLRLWSYNCFYCVFVSTDRELLLSCYFTLATHKCHTGFKNVKSRELWSLMVLRLVTSRPKKTVQHLFVVLTHTCQSKNLSLKNLAWKTMPFKIKVKSDRSSDYSYAGLNGNRTADRRLWELVLLRQTNICIKVRNFEMAR